MSTRQSRIAAARGARPSRTRGYRRSVAALAIAVPPGGNAHAQEVQQAGGITLPANL